MLVPRVCSARCKLTEYDNLSFYCIFMVKYSDLNRLVTLLASLSAEILFTTITTRYIVFSLYAGLVACDFYIYCAVNNVYVTDVIMYSLDIVGLVTDRRIFDIVFPAIHIISFRIAL